MKITGRQFQGYREAAKTFAFDVPPDSTLRFDASQSTLTVSSSAGSVLLAIKQVGHYTVDTIEVTWTEGPKLVE